MAWQGLPIHKLRIKKFYDIGPWPEGSVSAVGLQVEVHVDRPGRPDDLGRDGVHVHLLVEDVDLELALKKQTYFCKYVIGICTAGTEAVPRQHRDRTRASTLCCFCLIFFLI
jgi:hypothetical protein